MNDEDPALLVEPGPSSCELPVLLLLEEQRRAPARAARPLGYRFFFVVSLRMTSAAATRMAMTSFPTHLLGMSGTTLLRSGGPAEG